MLFKSNFLYSVWGVLTLLAECVIANYLIFAVG